MILNADLLIFSLSLFTKILPNYCNFTKKHLFEVYQSLVEILSLQGKLEVINFFQVIYQIIFRVIGFATSLIRL